MARIRSVCVTNLHMARSKSANMQVPLLSTSRISLMPAKMYLSRADKLNLSQHQDISCTFAAIASLRTLDKNMPALFQQSAGLTTLAPSAAANSTQPA